MDHERYCSLMLDLEGTISYQYVSNTSRSLVNMSDTPTSYGYMEVV